MVLLSVLVSAIPNLTFIPTSGPLDLIFHQSWLAFSVLGVPAGGYKLCLLAHLCRASGGTRARACRAYRWSGV